MKDTPEQTIAYLREWSTDGDSPAAESELMHDALSIIEALSKEVEDAQKVNARSVRQHQSAHDRALAAEAKLAEMTVRRDKALEALFSQSRTSMRNADDAEKAEAELAAAQATIAAAPHDWTCPARQGDHLKCLCWKADTSTAAFDRAIREAKAGALEVTDARTEVAARALFEAGGLEAGDCSWAEVARDDQSRADLWRNDARQVLDAIRAEAIREGGDTE